MAQNRPRSFVHVDFIGLLQLRWRSVAGLVNGDASFEMRAAGGRPRWKIWSNVAYFDQVRPRFTSWILAALLAASMPLCVPVSSATAPAYGIVRVYAARRTEQKILEPRLPQVPARRQFQPQVPSSDFRGAPLLDASLFQRPPPAVLPSRV